MGKKGHKRKYFLTNSSFVEKYQTDKAVEDIENFIINDLSNWYVRRSRDRVALYAEDGDKKACLIETRHERNC